MTNAFDTIKWISSADRGASEQNLINLEEGEVYQLWAALKILLKKYSTLFELQAPEFLGKNSYKSSSGGASGPAVTAKEKYISDILNYSPSLNFIELEKKGYKISHFVNQNHDLTKPSNKELKLLQKKKLLARTNSNPFTADIENERERQQLENIDPVPLVPNDDDISNKDLLLAITSQMSGLNTKVDDLGQKIDSIDSKVKKHDTRLEKLESHANYTSKTIQKKDETQRKLINALERKMHDLKTQVESKISELIQNRSQNPNNETQRKRLPKFIYGSNDHDQKVELGTKRRIHLVYKLPNDDKYDENWIRKNTAFPAELAEIVEVSTLQCTHYTSQVWSRKSMKVTFESETLSLWTLLSAENRKYFPCGVPICKYNYPRPRSRTVNGVSFYVSEGNNAPKSAPKSAPKTQTLQVPQFRPKRINPTPAQPKPILKRQNSSENHHTFPAQDIRFPQKESINVTITPPDDIRPTKDEIDYQTRKQNFPSQKLWEANERTKRKLAGALSLDWGENDDDGDSVMDEFDENEYERLDEGCTGDSIFENAPGMAQA